MSIGRSNVLAYAKKLKNELSGKKIKLAYSPHAINRAVKRKILDKLPASILFEPNNVMLINRKRVTRRSKVFYTKYVCVEEKDRHVVCVVDFNQNPAIVVTVFEVEPLKSKLERHKFQLWAENH